MTGTTYSENHNIFYGTLRSYDFEMAAYHSMSEIASKIASDQRFDDQCRRNCIARDNAKKGNK